MKERIEELIKDYLRKIGSIQQIIHEERPNDDRAKRLLIKKGVYGQIINDLKNLLKDDEAR